MILVGLIVLGYGWVLTFELLKIRIGHWLVIPILLERCQQVTLGNLLFTYFRLLLDLDFLTWFPLNGTTR